MLQDIEKLVSKVFDESLPKEKNLQNPKSVYKLFRAFEGLIYGIHLLANHYLSLDFKDECLQNSSLGTPQDKWRFFFNEDLEEFDKYLKKFLVQISWLKHEDMILCSYVCCLSELKEFYSLVQSHYCVGRVEKNSTILSGYNLKEEKTKIDLTSFEQRTALKKELLDTKQRLEIYLVKLQEYIYQRYTMDDLLELDRIR